jgi:hypothetical protein
MRLSDFGRQLDERMTNASMSVARQLDRRQLLKRALGGSAIVAAGLAIGSLSGTRDAFASTSCQCGNWIGGEPGSPRCANCPTDACPSGYHVCKRGSGCSTSLCDWASGSWVACDGFGTCGNGFRVCYDCRPNSNTCSICTCMSACKLCNACSAEEVRDAMLAEQGVGQLASAAHS